MRYLAALAVLALACAKPMPQLSEAPTPVEAPAAAPAKALATPPPGADADTWKRLFEAQQAETVRLTGERDAAQAERDHWKSEAQRYEAGLQRAVAKLNEMGGQAEAVEPSVPQAHVWVGTPEVQPIGDTTNVNGMLYNQSDADAYGSVTIDLLLNGRVIDTASEQFQIVARSQMRYGHTFQISTSANAGTYSGRMRVQVYRNTAPG